MFLEWHTPHFDGQNEVDRSFVVAHVLPVNYVDARILGVFLNCEVLR